MCVHQSSSQLVTALVLLQKHPDNKSNKLYSTGSIQIDQISKNEPSVKLGELSSQARKDI